VFVRHRWPAGCVLRHRDQARLNGSATRSSKRTGSPDRRCRRQVNADRSVESPGRAQCLRSCRRGFRLSRQVRQLHRLLAFASTVFLILNVTVRCRLRRLHHSRHFFSTRRSIILGTAGVGFNQFANRHRQTWTLVPGQRTDRGVVKRGLPSVKLPLRAMESAGVVPERGRAKSVTAISGRSATFIEGGELPNSTRRTAKTSTTGAIVQLLQRSAFTKFFSGIRSIVRR